jgi:hypothetical protein
MFPGIFDRIDSSNPILIGATLCGLVALAGYGTYINHLENKVDYELYQE